MLSNRNEMIDIWHGA